MKKIHIQNFGKDHWSTFAYLETLSVDHEGMIIPDVRKMRTNHHTHPSVSNPIDGSKYPTVLRDGTILQGHDDWNCVDDLIENGLLNDIGTGTNGIFRLTVKGKDVANLLREHKSKGGKFKDFGEKLEEDGIE